jgi:hypothetical protein
MKPSNIYFGNGIALEIEDAGVKVRPIILQVNYKFNRTVFYNLTQKEFENAECKSSGFVAVWKLRKLTPYGPAKLPPIKFLADHINKAAIFIALSKFEFDGSDFEYRPSNSFIRFNLINYNVRQALALFSELGSKNIETDII